MTVIATYTCDLCSQEIKAGLTLTMTKNLPTKGYHCETSRPILTDIPVKENKLIKHICTGCCDHVLCEYPKLKNPEKKQDV